MAKSERRRARTSTQLLLPFPKHFLIDVSVSRPSAWKGIFAESGNYATTILELGLQQNVDDDVVSETAEKIGAWVVTEDKEFHYEAATGGVFYTNIIFLVGENTLKHEQRLQVVKEVMNEVVNYAYLPGIGETQNYYIIWDLDTGQVRIKAPPTPPPELLRILPALSKSKNGLRNADLRKLWNCSSSTAWRKAACLVREGWLRKARKTKGRRYFRGPKLEEGFRRFISNGT